MENSKEFELDFIHFDKHRMSNLTPNNGGNDEFIMQAMGSNMDQDEFIQMKKEMERHNN